MPSSERPVDVRALAVAVFLAGAVLLGVEIVASRVLAPSFGNSLYVWGSLIGVVLTGLAVGYWIGGVLADRFPSPYLLLGTLTLGAGLVLVIPVADGWVIDRIVDWDPGDRLNPLLASIVLFGPMAVVIASASPIAVRLAATSVARLGHTAGRLFSISTAGSIFGTFATAFWLVPELGTDQMLGVGGIALLAAAAGFALTHRLVAVGLALVVVAGGVGGIVASSDPQKAGSRLTAEQLKNYSPLFRERERRSPGALSPAVLRTETSYEVREARDTQYHRMWVLDGDDTRYLRFDSTFQSGMSLDDPYETIFDYSDYMQLGLAYAPSTRSVLHIGLGGGTVAKRMLRDFPSLRQRAVEIDPEVVRVARRWFGLPGEARLPVSVQDGRRYLQTHDERWDMIVVDAFFSDSIPSHLATRQFYELLRSRLTPGGVVVSNVIGAVAGEGSGLLRSMLKTYRTVFPTVAMHPIGGVGSDTNVAVVATEGALPSEEALRQNWNGLRRASPNALDLDEAIGSRWDREVPVDDVPILTDGFAPTDSLLER